MSDIPQDYRKDFDYLKGKSANGSLQHDNNILKKLEEKAKNLPGLKRALDTLNVNY